MSENTHYVAVNEVSPGTPVVPVGASMSEETAPVEVVMPTPEMPAPPSYQQSIAVEDEPENATDRTPLVASDNTIAVPPAYNIATDLPSYEEAERSKAVEEQSRQTQERSSRRTLVFGWLSAGGATDDTMLGTDGIFVCTFLLAFIFNWLGLLASLCLTQTISGRLGALSGFGLSLVKYMLLFSHSGFGAHMHGMDAVVWWLLVVVGFLLFFRGVSQYIRVKYHWPSLNVENRRSMYNHYY